MELQQLQHFLAIARHENMARAADALNVSQSGLSRSIRALEARLGLPLFEREPRGVSLTGYGQALLVRAQVIVAEHDRALAEARAYRALKSGDVVLGLHPVLARFGGYTTIGTFLAARPGINLSIEVGTDPAMSARVATGELDIAFTLFGGAVRDPALAYEELLELQCGIYHRAGADMPGGTATLAALAGQTWALGGGLNFRRTVEAAFIDAGVEPPARLLQCSSISLLLDLVAQRDLVTILPDRLVALLPIGSLERVDVPAPGGRPRGGLVYRAEVMPQPAIAAIADHFRSVAQAIDGTDQAAFNARPA